MRNTASALLLAAILGSAFLVGCDGSESSSTPAASSVSTHEQLAETGMSKMREMVEVMKTIKDDATGQAAQAKLKSLAEELKTLQAKGEALGKLSAAKEAEFKAKYEKDMQPILTDLMQEGFRLSMNPNLKKYVQNVMPDTAGKADDAAN